MVKSTTKGIGLKASPRNGSIKKYIAPSKDRLNKEQVKYPIYLANFPPLLCSASAVAK